MFFINKLILNGTETVRWIYARFFDWTQRDARPRLVNRALVLLGTAKPITMRYDSTADGTRRHVNGPTSRCVHKTSAKPIAVVCYAAACVQSRHGLFDTHRCVRQLPSGCTESNCLCASDRGRMAARRWTQEACVRLRPADVSGFVLHSSALELPNTSRASAGLPAVRRERQSV